MVEDTEIPSIDEPAAAAMPAVVALRRLVDRQDRAAMVNAVADGWPWAKVGQVLEVSPRATPYSSKITTLFGDVNTHTRQAAAVTLLGGRCRTAVGG